MGLDWEPAANTSPREREPGEDGGAEEAMVAERLRALGYLD